MVAITSVPPAASAPPVASSEASAVSPSVSGAASAVCACVVSGAAVSAGFELHAVSAAAISAAIDNAKICFFIIILLLSYRMHKPTIGLLFPTAYLC